jgi:succinate dehydrogenase/fumarate reductase flavoprotein subunit
MSKDFDLIVIGSGIAGHCAALEALEGGGSVLMLESERVIGGSSRLSTGMIMGAGTRFQRARGIEDEPELLYQHYMTANQWSVQPSVARRLCYEVGPTIEWLHDRGVAVIDVISSGEEDRPRGHVTEGGAAIIAALEGRAAKFDRMDVALNSRVDRLVVDSGAVTGVSIGGESVAAGAVVIATGGFAANHELVARWYPAAIPQAAGQLFHQGTPWAKGDAFSLVAPLRAQIASGRGTRPPIWGFGGGYLPTFAIVVNQLGRRFYTETASYSASEIAICNQPSAVSFIIFDHGVRRALKTADDVRKYTKMILPETEHLLSTWTDGAIDDHIARGDMVRADSIGELAQRIGVPRENLEGTIERYNGQVEQGCDADYLKNTKGVMPIASPPFYAAPMKIAMLALTAVGPRVDHEACVLHETSRAIPGLYAAGECAGGVLGSVYVGSGNSVGNCGTYGRIAGRNAHAHAKKFQ